MALIKTDWTKELAQVEATFSKLIDEKAEPLIDRALDRSVKEVSVAMDKASFEIQDAIKQLSAELKMQKDDFFRGLIYLASGFFLLVFAAIGFTAFLF